MGRQLKSISGNGKEISYKYNDSGIRTEKTVNGVTTKYYLSGDAVTLEDNGTDKIYYTYDADGDLISMNLNGKEYFYIRNVQNDVIGLHDSEGKVVVSYSYDTWGNIVSITGSLKDSVGVKNPYRYRGYRYDEETGLYYLQSRYYNAEWGRFINADAVIGQPGDILSFNMFAYCHNNPVNMSDESGYLPKWLKKAAKVVKKAVSKVVKKVKAVCSNVKKTVVSTVKNVSIAISTNGNKIKNTVSGSVKGGVITSIEGGISKVYSEVPSRVTLQTVNRASRRAGEMAFNVPVKGAKALQAVGKVENIGAVGGVLTGLSVWNNYHSGYSKEEALGRSCIDLAIAGVTILVGSFGAPVLVVAGLSIGLTLLGEAYKYDKWDKHKSYYDSAAFDI